MRGPNDKNTTCLIIVVTFVYNITRNNYYGTTIVLFVSM